METGRKARDSWHVSVEIAFETRNNEMLPPDQLKAVLLLVLGKRPWRIKDTKGNLQIAPKEIRIRRDRVNTLIVEFPSPLKQSNLNPFNDWAIKIVGDIKERNIFRVVTISSQVLARGLLYPLACG